MNFLAHIYLSGEDDFIKIGNFMADAIKGHRIEDFDFEIQKGVRLHRKIDTFTDAHPVFRQSTKRLHENYHHYSGVIVDVFYDHFLAKNWHKYSDEKLEDYVENFYQILNDNEAHLTKRTIEIMPYMLKQNWLLSYQTVLGIDRILTQMDRRTQNKSNMRNATKELFEFYADFEREFNLFFEDLREYVKSLEPFE